MTKSNRQIVKEAQVDGVDSSPAVVAYRMGQLEQTVKEGFMAHNQKLDKLVTSFATKSDFIDLERRVASATEKVESLEATDNRQQGSIDTTRRIINYTLTVFGIIAVLVAGYVGVVAHS